MGKNARHSSRNFFCEILTKNKFEFFKLNFVKFRSFILEMLHTNRGRTNGLTDRAVLLVPYKDVKGPENKLTALKLKQEN